MMSSEARREIDSIGFEQSRVSREQECTLWTEERREGRVQKARPDPSY